MHNPKKRKYPRGRPVFQQQLRNLIFELFRGKFCNYHKILEENEVNY